MREHCHVTCRENIRLQGRRIVHDDAVLGFKPAAFANSMFGRTSETSHDLISLGLSCALGPDIEAAPVFYRRLSDLVLWDGSTFFRR